MKFWKKLGEVLEIQESCFFNFEFLFLCLFIVFL